MSKKEEKLLLKKILGEAQYKVTSDDFNEKVLTKIKVMSMENRSSRQLKIALLYNSLILVLIFCGIFSYLNQMHASFPLIEYFKILNINEITVIFSFTVFSIYILISDLIDKKITS